MRDPAPYLSEKAAIPGSSLYYAGLYETASTRQRLQAVLTLHREIFDCLTDSPDPGVTRIKLQWWQEELQRLFNGEPRHPVTRELGHLIHEPARIRSYLLQYFDTVDSIASARPLPTLARWQETCLDGLGQIWECLPEHGNAPETPRLILTRNGGAILALEMMQNAGPLLAKGYPLIPQDILDKHDIQAAELTIPTNKAGSAVVFGAILDTILNYLETFEAELKVLDYKPALYHLVLNRIARSLCHEIQADGCQLLEHRVALTPIRKLWIAWKTRVFY